MLGPPAPAPTAARMTPHAGCLCNNRATQQRRGDKAPNRSGEETTCPHRAGTMSPQSDSLSRLATRKTLTPPHPLPAPRSPLALGSGPRLGAPQTPASTALEEQYVRLFMLVHPVHLPGVCRMVREIGQSGQEKGLYRMYKSVRQTVSGDARGTMKGDTGYPTGGGKGEGV